MVFTNRAFSRTEGSNPSSSSGESVQTWLPLRAAADEGTGGTRNPWDIERAPGGSSSGSAAALGCAAMSQSGRQRARQRQRRVPATLASPVGETDPASFHYVLNRGPTNFFNR